MHNELHLKQETKILNIIDTRARASALRSL